MFKELTALMQKPNLYEKGTSNNTEIWTDEHISKGMLEAHLNPNWDAATRNHAFVRDAAKWIGTIAPADKFPALLDLGCGPGIYAELLHGVGYQVTGVDISERSITYARNSAKEKGLPIKYHLQDYFEMNFVEQFNIATLIYYEYGVFATEDRVKLLANIRTALKPGGLLIFDVNTPPYLADRKENASWNFESKEGFFSPCPHLELNSIFLYGDKRTKCDRHIVITEQGIKSYNLWEHTFTKDELTQDLSVAGYNVMNFYGNIAGAVYTEEGKEMCVIAQKEEHCHDSI